MPLQFNCRSHNSSTPLQQGAQVWWGAQASREGYADPGWRRLFYAAEGALETLAAIGLISNTEFLDWQRSLFQATGVDPRPWRDQIEIELAPGDDDKGPTRE